MAKELGKYNTDVSELCEARLAEYDNILDWGYTFFWSSRGESECREAEDRFGIIILMIVGNDNEEQ